MQSHKDGGEAYAMSPFVSNGDDSSADGQADAALYVNEASDARAAAAAAGTASALNQGGYKSENDASGDSDYENADALGTLEAERNNDDVYEMPSSGLAGNAAAVDAEEEGDDVYAMPDEDGDGHSKGNTSAPRTRTLVRSQEPGQWTEKFLPGQVLGRGLTQKYEDDRKKRMQQRQRLKAKGVAHEEPVLKMMSSGGQEEGIDL